MTAAAYPYPAGAVVTVLLLRLRAPQNGSHGAWQTRWRDAKQQRADVRTHLLATQLRPPALPVVVTLTRVAPRPLDAHDNLPASFKHVADGVADYLGTKDSDPRITWRYDQCRGVKGEYAAHVAICPAEGT